MPSTDSRFEDAEGDIWQHMVNNYDWTYHHLLIDRLNILETCLHPLVVSDEQEASEIDDDFNRFLEQDGYRLVITYHLSGRAVFSAVTLEEAKKVTEDPDIYEIVLSFAGEDCEYVEQVATYLRERGVRCFYDRYEDVTLWRKDLGEHLHKIHKSARFCVIIISKHYAEKV